MLAHLDLGAKETIGIHYDTFEGHADEKFGQAAKDLELARKKLKKLKNTAVKTVIFGAWNVF